MSNDDNGLNPDEPHLGATGREQQHELEIVELLKAELAKSQAELAVSQAKLAESQAERQAMVAEHAFEIAASSSRRTS